MARPWLSVVIPAYNEERGIAAAVAEARAWLERSGRPVELIVVDNASTDSTVERVAPLMTEPHTRLLRNESNRGKGFSVRRGMLAADGELRLHCDADCTPSLPSLTRMLELIEDADVVVGSRLAAGASVGRRQPLRRRVVGRTFVDLCRLVLREPTRDLYCGFKLWREHAARETYERVALEDWVFDAEALALARTLGFRMREVGIVWSDRHGSRLSMPRVVVPAVRDLLTARRHIRAVARARLVNVEPAPSEPRP
jgi:dolichyl-phosphate beta-glucosyltransferase